MNEDLDRRTFLKVTGRGLGFAALAATSLDLLAEGDGSHGRAVNERLKLRVEPDATHAGIQTLSWDTEGGNKAQTNLLRRDSYLGLRIRIDGAWKRSEACKVSVDRSIEGRTLYEIPVSKETTISWLIQTDQSSFMMTIATHGNRKRTVEAIELCFPFDPRVTPTTLIPRSWQEDGSGVFPAIISSPDFGQLLVGSHTKDARLRLEGNRGRHTVDVTFTVPHLEDADSCTFDFSPIHLSPPDGMKNHSLWKKVRRGWFNAWQPSSKWGDQSRPYSAPAGILANNVISDPVSFALPFYADQAFWTPQIAPGISIMGQVKRSINWWIRERTDPSGEVIGYWNYRHFLDANPGIIIASWDYVEATDDCAWLSSQIIHLERLASFLESRDIDNDGLIEATQSGNYGTLIEPGRSCCWFDALNCGYKDGYSNAYIYRAWRCLAELESRLGRTARQEHYEVCAERLKAAYFKTLYNPSTGWLAWWKSSDGRLHDYATPVVNGLAIEYGLVEPHEGRKILARLRKKMRDANFSRLDLGLPCTLEPVLRADYLLPDGLGVPHLADGTDTFQDYMNGGISAGHSLHFIMAHHLVGESEKGDQILWAMLNRQAKVGFQDGVQNRANAGIDWTSWNGTPKGYEGYLADVFMFLQAAILREPSLRARFYRPLNRSISPDDAR